MVFSLNRCQLCKERSSGPKGCCGICAKGLFKPQVSRTLKLSLGTYEGRLEQAVRALKYKQVTRLAKLFGFEIAKEVTKQFWTIDAVTAVPLHWRRFMERGYNQAALVGREVAEQLEIPYEACIKRKRYTQQQAKLSGHEREQNVRAAFNVLETSKADIRGKRILLIDDVYTTGMTLEACKRALELVGAKSVYIAVVARAQK